MAKKIMNRKASDNKYLHKDFHIAMNCMIEYLHKNYGEKSVREYLKKFTDSFYINLKNDIINNGLIALKEHFAKMYRIEGGNVQISLDNDELIIQVYKCPAVTHINNSGQKVSQLFYETTKTVNEALCEDTPFASEFRDYDHSTGSNVQRFYKRRDGNLMGRNNQ